MKFTLPITGKKANDEVQKKLNFLNHQIEESNNFIRELEKGNLAAGISEELKETALMKSLESLKEYLLKIEFEEKQRNWVNTGIANFSDILRNNNGLSLNDICQDILKNLIKYVNGNQGAIFIINDDNKEDEHLRMVACYAYDRKKFLDVRINPGEGLAGQCMLEKDIIYLTDLPQDYINITSGLGHAKPGVVLICPLMTNDKIYGVIEIASFVPFESFQVDFMKRLSESIASTIKNIKDNERTKALLNISQQQEEELRAQEEETRQNLEEMKATQEDMEKKNIAIELANANANAMLTGINATMATIEFSPEGLVLAANENFLSTVGYTLKEIVNKPHRIFVPQDIQNTADYQTFWSRLAEGNAFNGIFKRINSKGEVLFFNAIYNPIKNPDGKVEKVIKFATDITQQQEMQAENKGILSGINSTMAVIEFTPKGIITKANENFLQVSGYTLDSIAGKHHQIFVPQEILDSEEYKEFWHILSSGKPITGEFKRINSKEKVMWLRASYTPIFNASGQVYKVIKYAVDITSFKQNDHEIHFADSQHL